MAKHALEDLDENFRKKVQPGDIIVAGSNWGCGSSREQAVICLKENGLGAIIARSFGRIFYRNCLNAALPALTCSEAFDAIQDGDDLEINLEYGEIRCSRGNFHFPPLPEEVTKIFTEGGLVEYTRKQLSGM